MFFLLLVNFAIIQPLPTTREPCVHVQRFDPLCELWSDEQCNGVRQVQPFTSLPDTIDHWEMCSQVCNNTVSWNWDVYCSQVPQAIQSIYPSSQNESDCNTLTLWQSTQTCHRVSVSFNLDQSAWIISPDPARRATWYPQDTWYEEAFSLLWNQSLVWTILPTAPNCAPVQRQLWFDTFKCPADAEKWQVTWARWQPSVYAIAWTLAIWIHFLYLQYGDTNWSIWRLLCVHALWILTILVYASLGWGTLVLHACMGWSAALGTAIFCEVYSVLRLAAKWRLPSTRRIHGYLAFLSIGLLWCLSFVLLSHTVE